MTGGHAPITPAAAPDLRQFDLSGRVALVAGASGGIGSAVAEVLAESGADVVLSYRSNEQRITAVAARALARGVRVRVAPLDATDLEAVERFTAQALAELGRIDILANCVGSQGEFQLFRDQTPEQWETYIGQHFRAGLHLVRAVMGHMLERGSGRIIHLSSDGAKAGQSGTTVANGASAALISFSKSLAREISREGVTVNAVCPGPTRTPWLDERIAADDTGAKLLAGAARAIPMKRIAEAREVAAAFAFLASDAASFITGQALSVSGGLTMS